MMVETFGDGVREARLRLGLTQKQMAHVLGVGRSTIRHWEHGRMEPMGRRREFVAMMLRRAETQPDMVKALGDVDRAPLAMLDGQQIQEIREGLGMSGREFAERLGVSPETVSRWENGRTLPSVESLRGIHILKRGTAGGTKPAVPNNEGRDGHEDKAS